MNIYGLIKRFFTERDRDRLDEKMDHLDARIDDLAIWATKISTSIESLNHVALSNQEVFEQKLNNARASQENLKDLFMIRLGILEELIKAHKPCK